MAEGRQGINKKPRERKTDWHGKKEGRKGGREGGEGQDLELSHHNDSQIGYFSWR